MEEVLEPLERKPVFGAEAEPGDFVKFVHVGNGVSLVTGRIHHIYKKGLETTVVITDMRTHNRRVYRSRNIGVYHIGKSWVYGKRES